MAIQAVLIDLDGTLWDSAPWFARLLAPSDVAAQGRVASALRTPSAGSSAARLLASRYQPAAFTRVCQEQIEALDVYPRATETLATIRAALPLGVVTNLPGWIARPMLAATNMESTFTTIQCAARGVRSKPSPALLRMAQRALDLVATDILYVGDSGSDRAAASATGMPFVHATWGYDAVDAAPARINAWPELLDLL